MSQSKSYTEVLKDIPKDVQRDVTDRIERVEKDFLRLKKLEEGDFVWFAGEKQKYTVQAKSKQYLICTKPFNAQKTVIYSVVDKDNMIRGVDNYYGLGYETKEDCLRACIMFMDGTAEFSRRNPPIKVQLRNF